jgi:hypothetical protein
MGKQFTKKDEKDAANKDVDISPSDRLASFADADDDQLDEGTAQYVKFTEPGTVVNGLFVKMDSREFKEGEGERECVVLQGVNGEKLLFAQSIIVNEIKKRWDLTKETGFAVRIKYMGLVKPNTPDQYQNFRLLFEPVKAAQ